MPHRLTNFPILLTIALYERQAKKIGTVGVGETLMATAEQFVETLPRNIKRWSMSLVCPSCVEGAKQDNTPQLSWKTLFKGEYRTLMRCVHFLIHQNRKRKASVLRYSNSRSNSTAHWIYKTRVYLLR
jgi:hypothetical protein